MLKFRIFRLLVWSFVIAGASFATSSNVPVLSASAQELPADSVTPLPVATNPPVFQRMEDSVDLHCPGAQDKLSDAHLMHDVPTWSEYVHFLIRCGEKQNGLAQARIYGMAVSQILGSVLYLKPDADEAAAWRKTAKHLIATARPEAKADQELVDHFNIWLDDLP